MAHYTFETSEDLRQSKVDLKQGDTVTVRKEEVSQTGVVYQVISPEDPLYETMKKVAEGNF